MKMNRKSFLKIAGLAALGSVVKTKASNITHYLDNHAQTFNMHGYSAPKLDKVRVGFVGVGSRGSGTVIRLASIEGVEVRALCDLLPTRVNTSLEFLRKEFPGHNPITYSGSDEAWKKA